ncbi:MAG: hypothetical protein KW804_01075 [Candidatus Doudnabacteria bacterium]|nr:hypothetical protein [Candidatus Doudnabacteria bacterium]
MNRIKTISRCCFRFLTLLVFPVMTMMVIVPAAASAQEKFSATLDSSGFQQVERTFARTPSGKFTNQMFRPVTRMLTVRAQLDRLSGQARWGLNSTVGSLLVENFYNNRYEDAGRDKANGRIGELELRGGYRVLTGLNVIGGWSRFGIETYEKQSLWNMKSDLSFRGPLVGAETNLSGDEYGVRGDIVWLPHLTRIESYEQTVPNSGIFAGDSETVSSGYQASVTARAQIWKAISVTASYHFRQVHTAFGNHLFRVIPDEDPENTRWNNLAFGVNFRF